MSPVSGSNFKNWECNNLQWTPLTDNNHISHKGCFNDQNAPNRALPNMNPKPVNSLDECYNYSIQNGYDVFGLQDKQELGTKSQCWTGKQDIDTYDKHGSTTCNFDGGDAWKNQVYIDIDGFRSFPRLKEVQTCDFQKERGVQYC